MDRSDDNASNTCSDQVVSSAGGIPYSSDISRRWEKINEDMKQIQATGVQGTSISAVYSNTRTRRSLSSDHLLPVVGFSCMTREPADEEIPRLVDDAIDQVLGPKPQSAPIPAFLRALIKQPGSCFSCRHNYI